MQTEKPKQRTKAKKGGQEADKLEEKNQLTNKIHEVNNPVSVKEGSLFFNLPNLMFWAVVIRFGFMFFNETMNITTDVDYHVYTEGAREMLKPNGSPYHRFTYRYTPLVAYMMIPNLQIPFFGKILFNIFDLLAIVYIDLYLKRIDNLAAKTRYKALAFWALNPFMAYINGRGSCESIALLLTAAMLYHIRLSMDKVAEKFNILIAGLLYGLLIHFRLYPVIFGLTLYIWINREKVLPRTNIWIFGSVTIAVNVALVLVFYAKFGQLFIDECFLYHLKRKDPRHNYSIFWLTTVYDYFTNPSDLVLPNMNKILLAVRLSLIVFTAISFRKNHIYAMLI